MNGWFIVLIMIFTLNVGVNLAKHGEPRNSNFSVWDALVGAAASLYLIYQAIVTGF